MQSQRATNKNDLWRTQKNRIHEIRRFQKVSRLKVSEGQQRYAELVFILIILIEYENSLYELCVSVNSHPLSGDKGYSHPVGMKKEVDYWTTLPKQTAHITVYLNENIPRAHEHMIKTNKVTQQINE